MKRLVPHLIIDLPCLTYKISTTKNLKIFCSHAHIQLLKTVLYSSQTIMPDRQDPFQIVDWQQYFSLHCTPKSIIKPGFLTLPVTLGVTYLIQCAIKKIIKISLYYLQSFLLTITLFRIIFPSLYFPERLATGLELPPLIFYSNMLISNMLLVYIDLTYKNDQQFWTLTTLQATHINLVRECRIDFILL